MEKGSKKMDKRTVEFDKNCSPYLAGERATFPEGQAHRLVSRGIAHYVQKKTDGTYVAVDSNNKVTVAVSEESINDNHKQDDEHGSESGEVEERSGDELVEEGTNTEEPSARRQTSGRRTRRARKKL